MMSTLPTELHPHNFVVLLIKLFENFDRHIYTVSNAKNALKVIYSVYLIHAYAYMYVLL